MILMNDLRFALRQLLKNPGFTAVAVLTLALGIGACTAIFSAVEAILLRPLPYHDAARLVHVWSTQRDFPHFKFGLAPEDYAALSTATVTLERSARYRNEKQNLSGDGDPEELSVALVSTGFFPVLEVQPSRGRNFLVEEENSGQANVAILDDALWRSRFGGDPDALGKVIRLNEKPYQVIGVMPPGFQFPNHTDVWIPLASTDRNSSSVLARIKSGSNLTQAQAEMTAMGMQLAKASGNSGGSFAVESVHEGIVGPTRPGLLILLGAVGLVLLIVCVNVGNLMLARGLNRQRELGIRIALGASRRKIIRTVAMESVLVAFIGGAFGVCFACWGLGVLRAGAPPSTPRLEELQVEPSILWIALAISTLSAILCGLLPALRFLRPDLHAVIKETGISSANSQGRSRLRRGLVVAEIALVLVLMTASALTMQSLSRLTSVDPGFRTDCLLTMTVRLSSPRYRQPQQRIDFLNQAIDRLRTLPGVEFASAGSGLILKGQSDVAVVRVEGLARRTSDQPDSVNLRHIHEGYFQTLGMRVMQGRALTSADSRSAPLVAVVNQAMARQYWPNGEVIGRRLSLSQNKSGRPDWIEVVGVVGDARAVALRLSAQPEVFLPFSGEAPGAVSFYLRTPRAPEGLIGATQREIWTVDPSLPISGVSTMDTAVAAQIAEPRFQTFLLGLFAAAGLLLSLIGIYGVLAYSVSQRTREFGMRMALGATPGSILGLVLGQGLKLMLLGVAIGTLAAIPATKLMQHLLFDISPTDPITFGTVAFIALLIGLAACYFPARRAAQIDPLHALRHE